MCLSRTIVAAVVLAGVLISNVSLADGPSAVAAMNQNMHSIGIGWDVGVRATPTLVRGIYKLAHESSSQFLGYINEGGTLLGDSRGWKVWGKPPRPMNGSELVELRSEIIRNIDVDRLIKVQYGDGGGRRMIMFSAVDCPFCAKFEARAAKLASSMNTTFYVVPSALRPLSYGAVALPSWRIATNIWCAKDNASAWLSYWSKKNLPASQNCEFDERTAEVMGNQLEELLSSVGITSHGVPGILREDGKRFTPQPDFDKGYAVSTFGPGALSSLGLESEGTPLKWLAANDLPPDALPIDSKSDDPTQGVAKSPKTKSTSIHFGGALKKLFQE